MNDNLTAQQRANAKQAKKRRGHPQFGSVLLSQEEKDNIYAVIEKSGMSKKDSLIAAYKALSDQIKT